MFTASVLSLSGGFRMESINACVVGTYFIISLILYSEWIYPILSPALGGGELETVTVWIVAKDFSEDARKRLPANSCVETGRLVRCGRVRSIPVGDSCFVIATEHPPALVLKGTSVKAFANAEP
jgi:hypothetical protein